MDKPTMGLNAAELASLRDLAESWEQRAADAEARATQWEAERAEEQELRDRIHAAAERIKKANANAERAARGIAPEALY